MLAHHKFIRRSPGGKEEALELRLVHLTRSGRDRLVNLRRIGDDTYQGSWPEPGPSAGTWLVQIDGGAWRLDGRFRLPFDGPLRLAAPGVP